MQIFMNMNQVFICVASQVQHQMAKSFGEDLYHLHYITDNLIIKNYINIYILKFLKNI